MLVARSEDVCGRGSGVSLHIVRAGRVQAGSPRQLVSIPIRENNMSDSEHNKSSVFGVESEISPDRASTTKRNPFCLR